MDKLPAGYTAELFELKTEIGLEVPVTNNELLLLTEDKIYIKMVFSLSIYCNDQHTQVDQ
jgi:hypothetical protein